MVHTLVKKSNSSPWSSESISSTPNKNVFHQPSKSGTEINENIYEKSSEQFFNYYKSVFDDKHEEELVNYIGKMNEIFFGLSEEDICNIAHKFAESKRIDHPFHEETFRKNWYTNFTSKYPEVRSTSSQEIVLEKSDSSQIEYFFSKLKSTLKKYKFPLSHIYTVGELCIEQVKKKIPHIVTAEHARQSLSTNRFDDKAFITTIFCCSAIGSFIPPVLILPESKYLELLCDSMCFKSAYGCNTSDLFLEWLKFFIETIRPSENKKVLLILENHNWYKSTEIFDYAAINNVIIFSLPRLCSNQLHPLNLSVFGSFKQHFHDIADLWSKNHVLESTDYNLKEIFLEAYLKSVKLQNAVSGFEKSGILKCHQDVSEEVDYLVENGDQSDGSSFLEANFSLIKREKFNFIWNDLQKKAEARRARKIKMPFIPYSLKKRKYKMRKYVAKNSSKKPVKTKTFEPSIKTRRSKIPCEKNFESPQSIGLPYNELKTENDESVIQVVYELEIDF